MVRGVRGYLIGCGVLGVLAVLAGCSGHYMFAERAAWRHDAEAQCINSGAVKESPGKVRIRPIEGPGMCGADFPLKVSTLGDGGALSYNGELRPPGSIPSTAGSAPPRWPIAAPHPTPPVMTQ